MLWRAVVGRFRVADFIIRVLLERQMLTIVCVCVELGCQIAGIRVRMYVFGPMHAARYMHYRVLLT